MKFLDKVRVWTRTRTARRLARDWLLLAGVTVWVSWAEKIAPWWGVVILGAIALTLVYISTSIDSKLEAQVYRSRARQRRIIKRLLAERRLSRALFLRMQENAKYPNNVLNAIGEHHMRTHPGGVFEQTWYGTEITGNDWGWRTRITDGDPMQFEHISCDFDQVKSAQMALAGLDEWESEQRHKADMAELNEFFSEPMPTTFDKNRTNTPKDSTP